MAQSGDDATGSDAETDALLLRAARVGAEAQRLVALNVEWQRRTVEAVARLFQDEAAFRERLGLFRVPQGGNGG